MPIKCPKGQILRVSLTKSTCITDKGKPGKGPKLIEIPDEDKGLLSKYGYSLKKNHEERIIAIKKAIHNYTKLKIIRHINALRTLQKSNEIYYKKLDRDLKWIQHNI